MKRHFISFKIGDAFRPWQLGFAKKNIGPGSILIVELQSVFMAMEVGWNSSLGKIIFGSDYLEVINLINRGSEGHHSLFQNCFKDPKILQ